MNRAIPPPRSRKAGTGTVDGRHLVVTLTLPPGDSTLDAVRTRFGLIPDDYDQQFGLRLLSRRRNRYMLRIRPQAASKFSRRDVHDDLPVRRAVRQVSVP